MIIKKPYETSSSEKNRIRKLHESANQLLSEAIQPTPAVSMDPCYKFVSTMSPSAAGLWNPSDGPLDAGSVAAGDIDCCQMLIGNFVGPYGDTAGSGMMQSHCDKEWNIVSGVAPVSSGWHKCCKKFGGHSEPNLDGPHAKKRPGSDEGIMFGKPATGFDSGRQEDLEEVRYMNELYEITLGHEDTPNPLEMDEFYKPMKDDMWDVPKKPWERDWEDMVLWEDGDLELNEIDPTTVSDCHCPDGIGMKIKCGGAGCGRTDNPRHSGGRTTGNPRHSDNVGMKIGEGTVYELPKRFGNKRLTESQLIDMVNTIVKEY